MPTVIVHPPAQAQLDAWDASTNPADWDLYDEAYDLHDALEAGEHPAYLRQGGRVGGLFVVPFGPHRAWLFCWQWAMYPETVEIHEILPGPGGAGQQ